MIKLQASCFYASVLALSAMSLLAQDAPTLRQGNTETGLFVGGGYGLGISNTGQQQGNVSGSSMHFMGGVDGGYAITKRLFLVTEASYFPSITKVDIRTTSQVPLPTGTITMQNDRTYDRRVVEFNGGVHYRLPVPESRFVPYLVGGAGGVRFSSSDIMTTSTNLATGAVTPGQGQSPLPSQIVAAIDGGAGARFYVTEHFGFRGEFRIFRPFGIDNLTSFYRIAGGIFFQLK